MNRPLFLALLLLCADAVAKDRTPDQVRSAAITAMESCMDKMGAEFSLLEKAGENPCGNSGCTTHFQGCIVEGDGLVLEAIQTFREKPRAISKKCKDSVEHLAAKAGDDNSWLESALNGAQLDLDGTGIALILYRAYYYDLMFRLATSRACAKQ